MSLRFVIGRAGSGKSRYCLEEIRNIMRNGELPAPLLIVPEQYTLQAEKNLIGMLNGKALIGAEILSFKRLAFRIFNETGQKAGKRMTASGKSMLLMLIIEDLKVNLKVFRNAAGSSGFVKTIGTAITEFKQYGVTPEILKSVAEKIEPASFLYKKLNEIQMMYEQFEERLKSVFTDNDDDLAELCEKIDGSDFLKGREIFVDSFDGFTVQEEKVLQKIMMKAKNVTIAICSDAIENEGDPMGMDIFEPAKKTIFRLKRVAAENNIRLENTIVISGDTAGGTRFKCSPVLRHIEENLYSYPFKTFKGKTDEVQVKESINPSKEVETVARDIISLCRDGGMRYHDIFVAARNLESYEALIKAVFKRYDIPFFMDMKREIANHPLIRLILGILNIRDDNWTYDSVFGYLKTGLTGICPEDIDLLENYVLASGIKGQRWTSAEPWYFVVGGIDLERIEAIRQKVIAPFLTFKAVVSGRKTAKELCSGLYDFLREIDAPARLQNIVDEFHGEGLHEDADKYGRVWNIIMEVFDLAVGIFGDKFITFDMFGRIISAGFAEYKIGLIPGVVDSVNAGSLERSKAGDVKAMFILGVNDGSFPMRMTNEGILSDIDREILRNCGVELAKDTYGRMTDEHFLVYSSLTTPSHRLYLNYASADSSGRAIRPSQIISRIEELMPGASFTTVKKNNLAEAIEMDRISHPEPTFEFLLEGMRKKKHAADPGPLWGKLYYWYDNDKIWKSRSAAAKKAMYYINEERPLGKDLYDRLHEKKPHMSVSRLEQYARCPYSYFMKYGLKAEERKIYKIEPTDTGILLHDIMDKFSVHLKDAGLTWEKATETDRAAIVDRIIGETVKPNPTLRPLHANRVKMLTDDFKSTINASLNAVAKHITSGRFRPAGSEIKFGKDSTYPPITVNLTSGETVDMIGKIDRMDICENDTGGTYIRIVDYKSGKKDFKLSEVYYGLQLQLPVYLNAIWNSGVKDESGNNKSVTPAGMFYLCLDSPVIADGRSMTDDEVENRILKELKMKGLVLAEKEVIDNMDSGLTGASMIIPVSINKSGEIGKNSSVADLGQFNLLRRYTESLMKKLIEEMKAGHIDIRPYKRGGSESEKGTTPCQYCEFEPVCEKELSGDDFYQKIENMSNEDAWANMTRETGEAKDG